MARAVIEACIYLALCWAFCSIKSVRVYLASLPSPHRWILTVFFGLLLAGHLINNPRLTFPMASWALYGKPEHPETFVFYRYQGSDMQGGTVELDPFRLLSPLLRAEAASKIKNLCRLGFSDEPMAGREDAQQKIAAILQAVGAVYNHRYPKRPIRTGELIRCSLNLRNSGQPDIRREALWRVSLALEGDR